MSFRFLRNAFLMCTVLLALLLWLAASANSRYVFAYNLNNLLKGFTVIGEGEKHGFQGDLPEIGSGRDAH